jgi:hypothetical protein
VSADGGKLIAAAGHEGVAAAVDGFNGRSPDRYEALPSPGTAGPCTPASRTGSSPNDMNGGLRADQTEVDGLIRPRQRVPG